MQQDVREQIKVFWNKNGNYDQVAAHGIHSEEEKKIWKNIFSDCFGTGKKLKILDMGTGSGFLALILAEMQHEIIGADWSDIMLENARKKVLDLPLPVTFVKEDAENLSFEPDFFDAVVSRHMIWTLPDPQKVIGEWARVVKPGGNVIVDVPTEAVGKHHFNEDVGKELPFYNGAKPEELVGMFKKAGFTNEQRHEFVLESGKKILIMNWNLSGM